MSTRLLQAAPLCMVCRRPVEQLLEDDDGTEVVFTAVCHGQRERVRLRAEEAARIKTLDFGLAFASGQRQIGPVTP